MERGKTLTVIAGSISVFQDEISFFTEEKGETVRYELLLITNNSVKCGIGIWLQVHVLWLHRECFKQC